MKILVGEFITESNANIPQKCEISNYKMLFGDDCIQALHVADVFEQAGFELIPSVVADAGALRPTVHPVRIVPSPQHPAAAAA